jgi:hypothetical protein
MERVITWLAEFVTEPLNLLIFLFLWVGVALVQTDGTLETKALVLMLMGIPAALGYMIGRRK